MLLGRFFFNDFIKKYGGTLIFECNVNKRMVNSWNSVSPFYKDVLLAYFDFVRPDQIETISQCIWNNCEILIDNHPCIVNEIMLLSGMKSVSDLYYENGKVIDFDVWINRGVPKKSFLYFGEVLLVQFQIYGNIS